MREQDAERADGSDAGQLRNVGGLGRIHANILGMLTTFRACFGKSSVYKSCYLFYIFRQRSEYTVQMRAPAAISALKVGQEVLVAGLSSFDDSNA